MSLSLSGKLKNSTETSPLARSPSAPGYVELRLAGAAVQMQRSHPSEENEGGGPGNLQLLFLQRSQERSASPQAGPASQHRAAPLITAPERLQGSAPAVRLQPRAACGSNQQSSKPRGALFAAKSRAGSAHVEETGRKMCGSSRSGNRERKASKGWERRCESGRLLPLQQMTLEYFSQARKCCRFCPPSGPGQETRASGFSCAF